MKKIIILTTLLLVPFLANARQAQPEYIIKAKELQKEFAPIIYSLQEQAEQNGQNGQKINKRLLKTCKQVIDNSKMDIKFKRINEDNISDITVTELFYNVEYIKANLPKEIKEEQNAATLQALAEYIIKDNTEMNDFEALLAIGINPLEAAELTKDHCYIVLSQDGKTITYKHFEKLPVGYIAKELTINLITEEK